MKRKCLKTLLLLLAFALFLVMTLFLIRAFSEREVDDVSLGIICKQNILDKSEVLWIIPKFEGKPISENKTWCKEILSLNKPIGMHGVTHEFEEFGTKRNQTYLEEGMKIFEDCFGHKPTMFKPPQLKITEENKELIKSNNLEIRLELNHLFHKVYHCGEYGNKRNNLINWF